MANKFDGQPYAFVSYSHKDSRTVVPIIDRLVNMGYRIWYDEAIPFTSKYDEIIADALADCAVFVVFFTANSIQSEYVLDEVHTARDMNKKMHPVFLEDVELPGGTAMRLRRVQHMFLRDYSSEAKFLEDFCQPLFECRGSQTVMAVTSEAAQNGYTGNIFSVDGNTHDGLDIAAAANNPVISPSEDTSNRQITETADVGASEDNISILIDYDAYETVEDDSKQPDKMVTAERSANILRVGDCFKLGRYRQNGEKVEPIEWKVIKVESYRALVVSKYALEALRFNERYENVSWVGSTLRKWLNESFINMAFSMQERNRIMNTRIDIVQEFSLTGTNRYIVDRLFCLSLNEAIQLFKDEKERTVRATSYACKQGSVGGVYWWLRTQGDNPHRAVVVDDRGRINYVGCSVHGDTIYVRPAFYIKL